MNCHRRECAVSMRQVDEFPRLCSSAPLLTAGMIGVLALVFAAVAFMA